MGLVHEVRADASTLPGYKHYPRGKQAYRMAGLAALCCVEIFLG